ncbi:uncharacterized protein LOC142181800 [Nicotiana tabacum]|uniref:Uncharacterized protein LOC142181800 n=1 Tax=Nicotiana tabacum TaxID=4097 RepID=A0AC58UPM0_TOBAC
MDKSWIGMPRTSTEYLLGLNQFLDFAFMNGAIRDKIKCPCPKCGFGKWQTRGIMLDHLICNPFPKNYVTWVLHGEINVLQNSGNVEVTQDAPPPENPIELLSNEAFRGIGHEGVDEAKNTINKLCLYYDKIDACPNDYMLYWEGDANEETCKYCHTSRWKFNEKSNNNQVSTIGKRKEKNKKKQKKQAKILRYFPLKPRLQRLFMCSKTAEHMRWHVEDNSKDGIMRHPRDGEAWKRFDTIFPEFSSDPRNVRLGLASDGFNSFGTMSPRTAGNNIDVYLQPLIKELNELWCEGVETFDSSKNETFRMQAAFMWTVSDFPGLDTLSGWDTHTGFACPSCNFDTEPCRLCHSRKWYFMGHRRFLSRNHKFRLMRHRFYGNVEERIPPRKLSGSDILQQVKELDVTFGRPAALNDRRKRNR